MSNWRRYIPYRKWRAFLMRLLDPFVPIRRKRISIVPKRIFGFSGNIRVVTDVLGQYAGYDLNLYFEGELEPRTAAVLAQYGVVHHRRFRWRSALAIASSALIIVDHTIGDCYISRRKVGRTIVNLWHGVPIKCIEMWMPHITWHRKRVCKKNARLYDQMIASSDVDRLAIAGCFGVSVHKVTADGLPRYDLLSSDFALPEDLAQMEQGILACKGNKHLLLYAPTFRENADSPLTQFGDRLEGFAAKLEQMGILFGIRTHHYDKYAEQLPPIENVALFTSEVFPETNLVLKHTDILVTDFSSVWVDYLMLDRPILGFSTDFEHFRDNERGFIYDLENVFPGPFCNDVDQLTTQVEEIYRAGSYVQAFPGQKMFFLPKGKALVTPGLVERILGKDYVPS